eukprot:1148921-Pelagomonas_calceolata.AAC.2
MKDAISPLSSDLLCSWHKVSLHLYPELELDVEPEDRETEQEDAALSNRHGCIVLPTSMGHCPLKGLSSLEIRRLIEDYDSRVESEGELTEEEVPEEVLKQVEENCPIDRKHFAMFQARVSCAPDQVIRYCFKDQASPLWPSPANLPALTDVPPCKRCGAPRKFEFQVSDVLKTLTLAVCGGMVGVEQSTMEWAHVLVHWQMVENCCILYSPEPKEKFQGP